MFVLYCSVQFLDCIEELNCKTVCNSCVFMGFTACGVTTGSGWWYIINSFVTVCHVDASITGRLSGFLNTVWRTCFSALINQLSKIGINCCDNMMIGKKLVWWYLKCNPLVLKVCYNQCTIWFWENQPSTDVVTKNMPSNKQPIYIWGLLRSTMVT
jgi:hypothetical protein